jgi:hypothetical protein
MFERSKQTILAVLFALAACGGVRPQVADTGPHPTDTKPCFSSRIGRRDVRWFRHDLGRFSICIPETLNRRRTARCGDNCFIFENAEMYFDTDTSTSAWRPTFQKRYPSYTIAEKSIDGKQSTVWYFEDFGEYRYVSGANVILERGRIGMGVYLFSRAPDPRPIAEKMFGSIKFTKADSN